jgi:xanthine dehydrogenase large subunit
MVVIEQIMDSIARSLRLDPLDVRRRNFYGIHERNITHYGQAVEHNLIPTIVERLTDCSEYAERRRAVAEWNATHRHIKRGLALTPVKFGISFTATLFNQAGALVHVYTDGTVLLNHGGTEMGQGLFTKVAQVVATEFGVPLSAVRVSATDTSKVPNTSATAASASADLNGKAAQAAAQTIRGRLVRFACETYQVPESEVSFRDGRVTVGKLQFSFAEWVQKAYQARISLSSTGYYRTPRIEYDKTTLRGRPFFYYAYGAAVSEVAVDTLTGETQLLRVDILHDVGRSLNPAIDMGQIEGGFLQGVGWLTSEELWWNARGELRTHAPSTYKIPTARDWPAQARVQILQGQPNGEETIYRSKAVGEPPLMLAISTLLAIRDAIASCGPPGTQADLVAPATPEAVLRALASVRARNGLHTSPESRVESPA